MSGASDQPRGELAAAMAEGAASRRRLAFLAEVGRLISGSADPVQMVAGLAQLAIGAFADHCTVELTEEDDTIRRAAEAGSGRASEAAGSDAAIDHLARIVLETGQSARWPATTDDAPTAVAADRSDPEAGALPGSGLIVPLVARGRVVGTIAFRRLTADRPFTADDLALAEEIGRYTALGVENIRLEQDTQEAVLAREAERNRLQQILDVLPEGIALSDIRGQIIMSNLAAHEIWGQSRPPGPAGSGFPLWRLSGLPYPDEATPLARSILQGEEVRGEQMLSENAATGRRVPLLVNSAPLRNTAGTIVGGVAVFQDISPIKDLERQKDEFLAAVSHDLKNPLTTIKSLAQLLQRLVTQIEDRRAGRVLEKLTLVDETATRATAMLNEFVDIARVQMGRPLNLDERPHDLLTLAERVINEHQQLTETHTIQIESAAPSVMGVWDSVRLTRVLDNLVSNAIKYSPDGGDVVVAVTTEQDRAGSWAILQVRDHGLGIPAEEIPHVFERFFRGSNVTGKIGGTGIGLSGARQIVEQHGGKIWVESQEGAGSAFTVRLPLHDPEGDLTP